MNPKSRLLGVLRPLRVAIAAAFFVAAGGAGAGPTRLADLAPGSAPRSSNPVMFPLGPDFVVWGDGVPMALLDADTGALREVTCGTACRLSPGDQFAPAEGWTAATARVIAGQYGDFGLWAIDSARATARLLTPRTPQALRWIPGSPMVVFTTFESGPQNQFLWSTVGSVQSIRRLDSSLGSDIWSIGTIGVDVEAVWFQVVRTDGSVELGRTDGTLAGTRTVGALPGRIVGGFGSLVGGVRVFVVRTGDQVHELWSTTGEGTARVATHAQLGCEGVDWFYGWSDAGAAAEWGALRCWSGSGNNHHYVVTDGTQSGTKRVGGNVEWTSFTPVRVGDRLVVGGHDVASGTEARSIDRNGVVALVADLCPGSCSSSIQPWWSARQAWEPGQFPMLVGRGDGGTDIWVTNGLPGGPAPKRLCSSCTSVAGAVAAGTGEVFVRHFEPISGRRVLAHYAIASHRFTRLHDWEQEVGYWPPLFAAAGGKLLFAATSPEAGNEIWISDGTVGGTRMHLDLAPDRVGAGSSMQGLARTALGVVGLGTDGVRTGWWRLDSGDPLFLGSADVHLWSVASDGVRAVWAASDAVFASAGGSVVSLPIPTARWVEVLGPGRFAAWGFSDGLWVTNGTPGGSTRVVAPEVGALEAIGRLANGDLVLLSRGSEVTVWQTNGTVLGTKQIATLSFANYADLIENELVWFDRGQLKALTVGGSGEQRLVWTASLDRGVSWRGVAGSRVVLETTSGELEHLAVGLDGTVRELGVFGAIWIQKAFRAGGRLHLQVSAWEDGTVPAIVSTDGVSPWRVELEGWPAGIADPLHFASGEVVEVTGSSLWAFGDPQPRLLGAFHSIDNAHSSGWVSLVDAGHVGLSADRGPEGAEPWLVPVAAAGPRPAAPTELVASPAGREAVELQWVDRSDSEEGFLIEYRSSDDSRWALFGVLAPDSSSIFVDAPWEPTSWRVVAANATGRSAPSNVVGSWILPPPYGDMPDPPGTCVADDETLCLRGDRYAVRVHWRTLDGSTGVGRPIAFDEAGTTGFFWFFDETNVELVVKMLDAELINGRDWLFAGALSDVEYWISVQDTWSGTSHSYHNTQGNICGFADVEAFWKSGGRGSGVGGREEDLSGDERGSAAEIRAAAAESLRSALPTAAGAGGSALELLGERYRIEVTWHTPDGNSGSGVAVPASDRSGYFWFFNPANVELVVKMLDGGPVNGHAWLFHGALSDVEYEIVATDVLTGEVKTWFNPQGTICGGADVEAFPR